MLNVSYRNRIGYYTKTEKHVMTGEDVKFKNWICHANCLWADMYFYTLDQDCRDGKKGDKMAQVIAFWCDIPHLRRALKEMDAYRKADDFHFFADQMDADIWTAVKLLVNAGKKVTIHPSAKFTKDKKATK